MQTAPMGAPPKALADRPALGRWLARLLSFGTAASVGTVGIGLVVGLITGGAGGASIVAGGLLALALIPPLEIAVAAVAFGRAGESRYLALAIVVFGLLLAGLATAAIARLPGG
jgi:hypothetical protein